MHAMPWTDTLAPDDRFDLSRYDLMGLIETCEDDIDLYDLRPGKFEHEWANELAAHLGQAPVDPRPWAQVVSDGDAQHDVEHGKVLMTPAHATRWLEQCSATLDAADR